MSPGAHRPAFRITVIGLWCVIGTSRWGIADDTVNYNRDVRPILSDKCYKCHGPDSA